MSLTRCLSMVCIESDESTQENVVYNILQTIMHFARTIAITAAFIDMVLSSDEKLFSISNNWSSVGINGHPQ